MGFNKNRGRNSHELLQASTYELISLLRQKMLKDAISTLSTIQFMPKEKQQTIGTNTFELESDIKLKADSILNRYMNKPWQWMTQEKREKTAWNYKWWIMPMWRLNHIIFCYDVGYGHILIIDLNKEELHAGKDGIFTLTWCALGDYYGYPEGAYFEKVNL